MSLDYRVSPRCPFGSAAIHSRSVRRLIEPDLAAAGQCDRRLQEDILQNRLVRLGILAVKQEVSTVEHNMSLQRDTLAVFHCVSG